ncbi:MAG: TonB-dependent receptor [Candidatus Brevundimonas colombiensis]|uniref:TonB-dependent receptor n=1 Tax=Candidatus Brevundimonas colombiensis TaxID=3121376 RepID=A0AAJ6BL44_9CAUL|nr:TonB-dependent receptor [Brevundimonas sp.]WEK41103.1 MAG: TonB-dependent receptor [Brevundimonas sp.]
MTQTALLLLALAPAAAVQPAAAEPAAGQAILPQAATPPSQQDAATVVLPDVEVTAARRGVALGGQEPIVSYDTAQIQAFGATNIGELVTLLEAQTRSARGGSPVFLVNGRRISGFREIRGIPPEAIDRFDILPEETALSYGYSANQRVVNIVLKADFKSLTASVNVSRPEQGGRTTTASENNVLRIAGSDRWSLDINGTTSNTLFETERNIDRTTSGVLFDGRGNVTGLKGVPRAGQVDPANTGIDPALSVLAGSTVYMAGVPASGESGAPSLSDFVSTAGVASAGDLNAYRTLLPQTDQASIAGTYKHDLNDKVGLTLSGSIEDASSFSYLGLPGVTLTLPSANPFSPFGDDVLLYRYVDRPDALTRQTDTRTIGLGTVFDGYLGDWRWTATGDYNRVVTDTSTGRGLDATALQAAVTSNDPSVNPFGDIGGRVSERARDTARSTAQTATGELVLNGRPFELPAGEVTSTFKVGAGYQSLDSESVRGGVAVDRSQSRNSGSVQANFDLPISNVERGVLPRIGDLSANLNLAYQDLSDFGGVSSIGAGLNWSPVERLSLSANYSDEGKAPTVQQLNDPTVATPNTPVFDFNTNRTVEITQITGGDPNLKAEDRRILKLGVNWQPVSDKDLRLNLAYTRTEADNEIASFPAITPDLEAALPDRFVRDADGDLLSIDARPLNFFKREQQDVQWGFNFSRPFGKPDPSMAGRGPGGPPGGPGMMGPGPGGPRGPGGPPGRMRGARGPGMQPGQGMFNLSLTHTWRVQDEVTIRDGLAPLDLLNGDSISGSGGQSRHEVQLQTGLFKNGLGAFVNANWRSGTTVKGDALGSPDLDFSGRTTVNLFAFADLTQRKAWVERFPILKGARIGFGVQNIFDDRISVTSSDGATPINYQSDYLDPQGRVFRINLRKILF